MSNVVYIAVALDTAGGAVQDIAVCNSYSIAKHRAELFANAAPARALITVYESKELAVYSGRLTGEENED